MNDLQISLLLADMSMIVRQFDSVGTDGVILIDRKEMQTIMCAYNFIADEATKRLNALQDSQDASERSE